MAVGEPTGFRSGHQQQRIVALDGLRGLAILLVLFSHSVIYDDLPSLRGPGLVAGNLGVTIFFVLSGFLITSILLHEEHRYKSISLRLFFWRRSLRLLPAFWYYLMTLGLLFVSGLVPHHPAHSFLTSLLYVRNLFGSGHESAHLWSLSLEEQFYLAWPVFLFATPGKRTLRLALATVAVCLVTWWRCFAASNQIASIGALHMRTDFRIDAPMSGCVIALLVNQCHRMDISSVKSDYDWMRRLFTVSVPFFGLVGIGLTILMLTNSITTEISGVEATMSVLAGVLLVASTAFRPSSFQRGLFQGKPIVFLGKISYGVYLWQQLFLGPDLPAFHYLRMFPIGLITTICVALASYYLLELPMLRLKDSYFQRT